LLRRPALVTAVAEVPDGPPWQLILARTTPLRVRRARGPERLEPEWWRGRPADAFRDYYCVELESGARLWVYRAGPMAPDARWYLHGYLA
jgi:protein ImuB